MSTATHQRPPAIPPRPSRGSQEQDHLQNLPKVPPRPVKRGLSPNPDRYAPSPLNGGIIDAEKDPSSSNDGPNNDGAQSVEQPAVVGEEGVEYAALAEDQKLSCQYSASPEQTRTVDENTKIHAPTATIPASEATERIMQVTRTDSERAASFGIGKAGGELVVASNRSLRKKTSTASGLSQGEVEDEEHGIPEIGQQIPLLPNAGDVQAPSPAPGSDPARGGHKRKTSSRGLPPGSYGLHGHGVAPQDKLEKEYYQKHPELLKIEQHPYQHDRPSDFSMRKELLNKLVWETEAKGLGLGKSRQKGKGPLGLGGTLTEDQGTHDHSSTPSEQAGWAALEAFSRPHSTNPGENEIHIEEPNHKRSILLSGDPVPAPLPEEEIEYSAPILAEDEVRKNSQRSDQVACVEPLRERRGSDHEADIPCSRPTSRPPSRPASSHRVKSPDMRPTPLEDVEEYEPLFPDGEDQVPKKQPTAAQIEKIMPRFPSKDVWEDAPSSVHHTATVSTPDVAEEAKQDVPPREHAETPAQEWARKQELLAEQELTHPDAFLWRTQKSIGPQSYDDSHSKPSWLSSYQPSLGQEPASRPPLAHRFPSRDVWEETPNSLKLETTVSGPQAAAPSPFESKPQVPNRPTRKSSEAKEKPVMPERPKVKSQDEASGKPTVPDRPKPQIPAVRLATSSSSLTATTSSADVVAPKVKPAIPARPAGNKIAALQAGFMSDLNKKLGLGPRVPQPKEEAKDEATEAVKEKAPLPDARKGRARGPQRRAPAPNTTVHATSISAANSELAAKKAKLSVATTVTVWSIDPKTEGEIVIGKEVYSDQVRPASGAEAVEEDQSTAPAVDAATEEKRDLEAAKADDAGSAVARRAGTEVKAADDEERGETEGEAADVISKEPEDVKPEPETLATDMDEESMTEATTCTDDKPTTTVGSEDT